MRSIYRLNLRLRPSILVLFVLLTVPVVATIVWVTYSSNDKIARSHASELIERFRTVAMDNIRDEFEPIKSLVRSAAALGNQHADFYEDNRALKYFASILEHSDKITSVYVGLEDGAFRQTRRLDPKVEVNGEMPPEGTRFAYRLVEPLRGPPVLDRYVFLDADGKELGSVGKATGYDPRARRWYRNARLAGATMITDPDVFAALGLIGFTVAAPYYRDGKVQGVVAVDITLDGLAQYLVEHKVSAGSLSYILDPQGRVLAASDGSKSYANVAGNVELLHITSLDNELPAVVFGARPRQHERQYSFRHDGKEFVASLTTLPSDFGKRWQLFVVTPIDDFNGTFRSNNARLLAFGFVAVLLQILVIYFLASAVSAPLERLALKVGDIQQLATRSLPPVVSPVREIAVLSKAIDTLDAAVKSFASFVPVGLVTQLLRTEQKLELGGHSRFLTIFFSDLESFSSLSEEVPSQELLLRVSAYLEVATKAVNEEHGTIDKFVGDGVMAFWGAPALLEDHAWRSCVAAIRIQRRMEELNEGWRRQNLRALNARIGIHCDAVLVGNIGSRERMSYTVMGDGVNVAARLESLNKEYGTRICVSHSVFKEAGERLCVRPIDDVAVKGRRARIAIYELLGVYGAGPELEPRPEAIRLSELTRPGYDALLRGDFEEAARRYQDVLQEFPGDPVASTHVERLAAATRIDPVRPRGALVRS